MDKRQVWMLFAFLGIAAGAAAIGGGSTADAGDKYASLEQPSWAPPSWLFGPVWTVLYVMIGVAGWMFWRDTGWSQDTRLWLVQMGMNALWSPLFFAFDWYAVALVWILALDGLVIALIWRNRALRGWLMVPYLAWILFASCLNAAIWWLNR